MDNVSVSRRNHINKKGNKENAQPACGSKTFSKRNVSKTTTLAPLHLKSNEEETLAKDGSQKIKLKQVGVRVTSGEALKKAKQTDEKVGVAADAKKQTLSQAFLTKQAGRQRKIVAEAPKPPAAVPPPKSAPGMYKGKIIQSKIGSIWKSSTAVGVADPKPAANPSAPKAESQKVGNLAKIRSKSVADLPGRGMQKPKPTRSNSVSDGLPPVSKRPVTGRPITGSRSALPPARTVPATVAGPSSRNTTAMHTKATETQSNKPKRPVVTDKKVNKPPVSSTISQYRVTMETADERRAKLAEWLASRGKTLKRPAMAATHPKAKVATKPEVQSHVESQPVAQCNPEPQAEPELSMDAHRPGSTAVQPEDNQRQEDMTHRSPPLIMSTTLELLDDSDVDLPEAEPQMNDIVVNLCDALEAMATPSRCEDEPPQTKDKCNDVEMEDSTPKDECQDHVNEMPEECSHKPEDVEVKNKTEDNDEKNESEDEIKSESAESDDEEENVDDDDDEEEEEEEGKDVIETTPKMEGASVVKYSVKTTPYLQSVKKTIDGEVIASGSRRKSSIKDLKFLTPVRRSSRIQRKSSRLPGMLTDHDTCVSSLAELVKLDDEANAYIYRRNPALLEDLPDL